jgi:hypothetical protein
MTFATAVAFAPDESHVLSTSADASAVLTAVGRPGPLAAGGGSLLWVLAILAALLAMLLGAACLAVDSEPPWLPPQVAALAAKVAAGMRHS